MAEHGSVTGWLDRLRAGDRGDAVTALWGAYFGRLVGLARDHLRFRPRAAADEEDVALSAFDSFVRAAAAGRFPRLDGRDDLWQVLFVLTARKAADVVERETAAKRGGGRVVPLSALAAGADGSAVGADPPAGDPDPAEAAALVEGLERMLDVLGSPELQRVAVWRMEGHTNEEIAARLGRSVATAERKLNTIRAIYRDAGLWVDPPRGGPE